MRKLSQTEELAKILASRARHHLLTPEQVSRAMEEQEYDVAGLDALYEALEARGIRVEEEDASRCWTMPRSADWNMSFLPRAWRWTTR